MDEQQSHGSFPVEILNYRHTKPNDKNRQFTIVECIVLLPDGKRTSADIFLDGVQHFQGNRYDAHYRIGTNQRKSLELRIVQLTAAKAPAAARPTAPQA